MADNKLEKKTPEPSKIVCKGPKDKTGGVSALRTQTGVKKNQTLDIYSGQTVIVGRDISKEVASKLLKMGSWKFEEVK